MIQAIIFINVILVSINLYAKTIGQASAECFKIEDVVARKKCFIDQKVLDANCNVRSESIASCPYGTTEKLFSTGISCRHRINFWPHDGVLISFESQLPNEVCRIYEYQMASKDHYLDSIYFGHATFNGTKWVAAPPIIPFALRKHFSSKNIEIAEIRSRVRFLNGRFEINLSEELPHICIGGNLRSNFIFIPDPETGEFSSQPTEMQVDRVIEMFGLEKTEDFLRPDRHVIGRERIADYSVITRFNLKQPVKICGQSVPKGTQLTLSTTGPSVYGTANDICRTAADGALFILGIPNTAKKAEKGKPPTKTLSCIPKAHKMSQFDIALQLASSPSWKIKKKPVVDYDDCDCYAVEMRYPGT